MEGGGIKGFSLSPLVPVTEMHRQRESPPPPLLPPCWYMHEGSAFINIWKQPHQ